jgi:protein involved in polysaccharide export with SLBB domain
MKIKILLLLFALLCFGAPRMVKAQEQQGQPAVQSPGTVAPGVVNDLGIKNYLLGPGDTLDVRIFQQADLSGTVNVDDEGNVRLPFIAPIRAQCRTEQEVTKDIVAAYNRFLQTPQVSVRVTGRNSRPPAIVHGAITQPQRVQMYRPVRLNELIAVSGGFTEKANGDIQILHTEKVLCPQPGEVDEPEVTVTDDGLKIPYKVIKITDLAAGKEEANPVIRPGDVVTVLEAKPVYVTGAVVNPQGLYIRDKLMLSRALAMVGGPNKNAKTGSILIHRQNPTTSKEDVVKVDYAAIKKGQQEDITLQPYDIIEVPENSPFSGPRFLQTLLGGVMNIGPTILTRIPTRVIY